MSTTETPPLATRREWIGLGVLALPTFVVAIDLFVLMLALPNLAFDLGADGTQQLWAMDTYGFMVAGFLVTMGTLGDRIGRKKLLLIGAAAFGVASLLCAYSPTIEMLIAARALLGIAGATLGPSTLALIGTMFRDPKQQQAAFGLWGMVFTLGSIFGPVLGGFLLGHFWWGSVFLVGVPFMVATLILAPKYLPEFKNPQPGRIDPLSVVLSLLTLLPIIYAIKEFARGDSGAVTITALVVGIIAGVLFVRRQNSMDDPLLDLRLLRNRAIGTCLGGQLSYSLMGGGIMLLMMLYLQLVQGFSTLEAGLAMVPGMIGGAIGFTVGPKLAAKFRPAHVIAAGLVVAAIVLVVFTQVGTGTAGTVTLIVGFIFTAMCGAPMAGLGTGITVSSAPMEKMGSAGALAQMANEFGGTLGIAILGTIGAAVYRGQVADSVPASVPADAAVAARDSLAGAVAAGDQLPAGVISAANDAFVSGLHVASLVGAVLLIISAFAVLRGISGVPPFGQMAAPAEGAVDDDQVPSESH